MSNSDNPSAPPDTPPPTPSGAPPEATPGVPAFATGETGAVLLGPSWQEQDATLRELWLQNKAPQDISTVLNRSVAAIMTRAARLGLPRRSAPGRKPGSRRLLPLGQEARSAPRPASRPLREGEAAPIASARICLMCLRAFQSQGRHNRICSSCKGSSEYESAVALADIHFPV